MLKIRFVSYVKGRSIYSTAFYTKPYDAVSTFATPKEARAFVQRIQDDNQDWAAFSKIAWIKDLKTGRFI